MIKAIEEKSLPDRNHAEHTNHSGPQIQPAGTIERVSVNVCASKMKEAANRGGLSVFRLYILGVEAIGHFECVI